MNTKNSSEYFHVRIRKTRVWWVLTVAFVGYGAAILCNEFVWSKPGSLKDVAQQKNTPLLNKLDCKKRVAAARVNFEVNQEELPKRSIYLLERTFTYGYYLDELSEAPECLARSVLYGAGDPRNSVIYYFDRDTKIPVVKVRIQSID